MFKKRIPVFYLIIAILVTSALSIFAFTTIDKTKRGEASAANATSAAPQANTGSCNYSIERLNGYKYIHPMSLAQPDCESPKFNTLAASIQQYIEQEKVNSGLSVASVYMVEFAENEWMNINEGEKYHPGSLFKINTLIAFLKMEEINPGVLKQEIICPVGLKVPIQTFNSQTITPGHKYKISELLHYMTSYSDNNATMLLHQAVDVNVFQKVFADLGVAVPDVHNKEFELSVKDYSKFLRVLYDAGYLTIDHSEYAISMLAECDFKYGIVKELPPSVIVAHKFGEAGTKQIPELHETAIIYLDKKPYLLTVMTRGQDVRKQADAIAHISRMVYDHMIAAPAVAKL